MQGMSSSKSRSRAPEGVPTGGQFATERRPEVGPSTLLNLSDPPLLDDTHHAHPERVVYAERVGALPYEMPPVCAEHQAAGHPENSQEAFEQYFDDTGSLLSEHDRDAEAARGSLIRKQNEAIGDLARCFHTEEFALIDESDEPEDTGWHLPSTPSEDGSVSVEYWDPVRGECGPTLTSTDRADVYHAAQARQAHEDRKRLDLFAQIQAGEKPPWAFLPPTRTQRMRAENVSEKSRRDIRDAERRMEARQEAAGRYERFRRAVAEHEGMDDEQIAQAYRDWFEQVSVRGRRGFGGRVEDLDVWVDKRATEEERARSYTWVSDERLEDEASWHVSAVKRARKSLPEMQPMDTAAQARDEALVEEGTATVAQYESYLGWPGGDVGPQQSSDGSWHHMPAIAGCRRWSTASPR